MKLFVEKVLNFFKKYQIGMIFSIIASLVMSVFYFLSFLSGKSPFYMGAFIFTLLLVGARIICFVLNKKKENDYRQCLYSFPLLMVANIIMPSTFLWAMYRTEGITLPYPYLIIGYIVFAFFKLISAIVSLSNTRKNKGSLYERNCGDISLIAAMFSFFMFESSLIIYLNPETISPAIRAIELLTLVLVVAITFVICFYVLFRGIKKRTLDIIENGKNKIRNMKNRSNKNENTEVIDISNREKEK